MSLLFACISSLASKRKNFGTLSASPLLNSIKPLEKCIVNGMLHLSLEAVFVTFNGLILFNFSGLAEP